MQEPSITKIAIRVTAVLNRIEFVATAVPKTFAESFAPTPQPRNNPPNNFQFKNFSKIDIYLLRNYR